MRKLAYDAEAAERAEMFCWWSNWLLYERSTESFLLQGNLQTTVSAWMCLPWGEGWGGTEPRS